MIRLWIAGVLLAASLPAQLALNPSGTITLPTVYAPDFSETKVNLINAGTQSVTLATLSIGGTAFSIPDAPATPRQLAAGESLPFTVRFTPVDAGSFSAVLQAGSLTAFVLAKSLAAPALFVDGGPVHQPGSVDFGTVETGVPVTRHFSLRNLLRQPLAIGILAATGDFHLMAAPPLPIALAPGDSIDFDIAAKPMQPGAFAGALLIDDRSFTLSGIAADRPPPLPQIVFRDAQVKSAQQSRLSVSLSEPARVAAAGSVEFAFELLTNGLAGDPGVLFPASGTRSIGFTVAPGDTLARFGASNFADFQTGTTSGNLVFRIRFGDFLDTATLVVPPDVAGVDQIRATRAAAGIAVEVIGFDNTRSASRLAFTFFDNDGNTVNGNTVNGSAISVDATDAFHGYFQTSGLGGMFALTASFPVTGGADRIAGVQVDLVNSQGSAHSQRVSFR
ncbi:MAG: choice-of-anchor D domain-containing protein [Bryobacteraceae bacterium]